MAIKKPPERAAAARYPPPVHRRKKLIQRSIRLLVNERKDALGIVFQNRAAAAPRFRCTYPMITPTLQPLDRRAGTDFKALGRLTSRRSRLHCLDNSFAQVTRQRFRHPCSPHRRINADRLPQPNRFGNPPDSNPAEFALNVRKSRYVIGTNLSRLAAARRAVRSRRKPQWPPSTARSAPLRSLRPRT